MKEDIKNLWIAALRSGDYIQGTDNLTRVGTDQDGKTIQFDCCLGVLCKLAVKHGVRLITKLTPDGALTYDGQRGALPHSVREWAGIKTPMAAYQAIAETKGGIDNNAVEYNYCLSGLNDSGSSFDTISTVIAKYWKDI